MLQFKLFSYALILLSLVYGTEQNVRDASIKVWYNWTYADFLYPSQRARSDAINRKLFIPENIVILDTDYYYSNPYTKRVFVTTPGFRVGIPATISEVSRDVNQRGEHLLKPFRSWREAGSQSCEFARSVYRIHIDRCGLMWVLDSGLVNGFVEPKRACRPKILVYDLKRRDRLIARYEFPDGVINDRSILITVVTESYQRDCMDSIAYIADVGGFGIVVFDLPNRKSWRAEHEYFYPSKNASKYNVAGTEFEFNDGVFGLALGPENRDRKLYFHAFNSFREMSIPVRVLKNAAMVQNRAALGSQVTLTEEARTGQSSVEVMTSDGILLYPDMTRSAIMCWNSNTPFTRNNLHVIYQHDEDLQFVAGMKLKEDNVLVITSTKLQNYAVGRLRYPEIKYRMIVIDNLRQFLKFSACKNR